jgi:hypothetical protein
MRELESANKLKNQIEHDQKNKKIFEPEEKDKIVITVLDTGTGMSKKD